MMCVKMESEAVRFVSDRFEWASLTKRVGALYHRWEWAEQSRQRVVRQLPLIPIQTAYLRIWIIDSMVVCPLIGIGDTWYNAPRAQPMVVAGEPVDPVAALELAADVEGTDIVYVDDSAQVSAISSVVDDLIARADDHRERRSLAPVDVTDMIDRLTFADEGARDRWIEAVAWTWRAGWDARLVEYRADRDPIGWVVDVHHLDTVSTVAAAAVDGEVLEWTSPR